MPVRYIVPLGMYVNKVPTFPPQRHQKLQEQQAMRLTSFSTADQYFFFFQTVLHQGCHYSVSKKLLYVCMCVCVCHGHCSRNTSGVMLN